MNPQIQNQESMLKESIKHFLTSYHSGSSDFSSFESIFFRLIQTMLDPPLEITWFYSAVTYHAAKSSLQNNPSSRVLIAKDLLNLMMSCSNLSSASKKIALLAPVVYEVYSIVCDCRNSEVCEKMEVCKLVENMVSYVMMSAGVYDYGNEDVECDNAVFCFEDLVRVWTTDRGGGNCNFGECLRIFFPLLTEGTWKGMNARCGIRELVGIVLCEVFFLKLYLCFGSGTCTEDYLKDTRDQMVHIIKGFRNCYFLDMLLKMLSEPSLSVAASLSSEDAGLLRKALYDAVILVDYSFYSGRWVQPDSISRSKKLALVWVLASDRAIQFAWAITDERSAASYLNAFRESQMVTELIKWVNSQAGMVNTSARPEITTPRALISWLLFLEDQGIQVFDHSMSLLRAKAVACMLSMDRESPQHNLQTENLHHNLSTINPDKDQEMDDQLYNNGVPVDLCLMSMKNDVSKKRKEALTLMCGPRVKQVKLNPFVGENFYPFKIDGGSHGECLAIDISSNDDVEM